jgi:dihydroceramidase
MQLLDELPMIYGSAILIYANYDLILAVKHSEKIKSRSSLSPKSTFEKLFEIKPLIISVLVIYCLIVTTIYLSVWKNPIFHEVAYGFLVVIIIIESSVLISKLKSSKRIYLTSIAYYFFGFFLWNLDNKFCQYLQSYRRVIESYFGIDQYSQGNLLNRIFLNTIVVCFKSLLEFHSLWHLFTGYASYMTILFIINLNYQLHLNKTNQLNDKKALDRKPIGHKLGKLYYHLKNDLIDKDNDKINKLT